jgi:hypothetical protein
MWNGCVINLSLHEALSLWLGVLVMVLLSLLVMVMLFVLVSSFLLGFSLLFNETLYVGLYHVLDITIGQSLGTRARL